MTWLNPLALAGLVALGVPILIHLFGRRMARRLKFPSLRLLGDARPTPATRSVPSDVVLLVVRCAVLVAAALALAQPVWPTASRTQDAQRPVRVILVDTSESMRRLTSRGPAVDVARSLGRALLDSSRNGIIVETSDPGESLAGAASWLEQRGGRREVVVISDFQTGSVHDGQVGSVPAGIGLRFERTFSLDSVSVTGRLPGVDSVRADSSGTSAKWRAAPVDSLSWPTILASEDELARARHSVDAVRTLFKQELRPTGRVAVIFPGYASRRELANGSTVVASRWQGDLLVALRRDPVLANVMSAATLTANCDLPGAPVVSNEAGVPVATIAKGGAGAQNALLVFTCVDAGSLPAAALLAGLAAALDSAPPLAEYEPVSLPDELIQRWQREPTASNPRGNDQTSPDGRWLWLVALLFLGVEQWLRRRSPRRVVLPEEVAHVRVA